MKERTKRVYVELEMIDGIEPNVPTDIDNIYPHSGVFLLKRTNGLTTIVDVTKNTDENTDGNVNKTFGYLEIFLNNANIMESQFVMDSRDYEDNVAQRNHDLEQEYEKKRMELEHKHEMRMMELESETPKRFSQGEWVSGKTLKEIISSIITSK
ncbi:MAG: hypothetical protein IJ698_00405 [Prevotella sp.]|nr:hypothetical protein [Prevotella sp.]